MEGTLDSGPILESTLAQVMEAFMAQMALWLPIFPDPVWSEVWPLPEVGRLGESPWVELWEPPLFVAPKGQKGFPAAPKLVSQPQAAVLLPRIFNHTPKASIQTPWASPASVPQREPQKAMPQEQVLGVGDQALPGKKPVLESPKHLPSGFPKPELLSARPEALSPVPDPVHPRLVEPWPQETFAPLATPAPRELPMQADRCPRIGGLFPLNLPPGPSLAKSFLPMNGQPATVGLSVFPPGFGVFTLTGSPEFSQIYSPAKGANQTGNVRPGQSSQRTGTAAGQKPWTFVPGKPTAGHLRRTQEPKLVQEIHQHQHKVYNQQTFNYKLEGGITPQTAAQAG